MPVQEAMSDLEVHASMLHTINYAHYVGAVLFPVVELAHPMLFCHGPHGQVKPVHTDLHKLYTLWYFVQM